MSGRTNMERRGLSRGGRVSGGGGGGGGQFLLWLRLNIPSICCEC